MSEVVKIELHDDEFRGLARLCAEDLRNPPFELRWLLLNELERRSMLPAEAVKRLHAGRGGSMPATKK